MKEIRDTSRDKYSENFVAKVQPTFCFWKASIFMLNLILTPNTSPNDLKNYILCYIRVVSVIQLNSSG